ncbi:B12-binding domain-containing radical SAM protein [Acidobacteria bacterium AH-259-O06]|nr:B12-binding domain-containing radical SAM protein [Acidobacteria bacterium AH-259-O06]
MPRKRRVVLYNPQAEFFTMPLALLAVGSALDPRRYEVLIVDGRLERKPLQRLLPLLEDAFCLGITVLTGSPIGDAIRVSRAVKAQRPDLPVIWGGWHPSLFARECLAEELSIDTTVRGQGEETFREAAEKFPAFAEVSGCAYRDNGQIVVNPPRALRDINTFPAHNYDLIPVERYFRLKKRRQLDYISSQGCQFRCAFCADPSVYDRKWVGLDPERIGEEVEFLWHKFGFMDLNFQDETFFTRCSRVEAIAEQFLRRGIRITWAATLRADQGVRVREEVWQKCKKSGLRRVMVGVESGSVEMLKWMAKDITLEQVFTTAERCVRHGVAAIFPFIVGFPGEPEDSVNETLKIASRLRSMSTDFQVVIFFYQPYPGSPIAPLVEKAGYPLPRTLEEWSKFDYVHSCGPWVDAKKRRRVEAFKLYQRLAWSRPFLWRQPVRRFAQWRCRRLIQAKGQTP